MLSVRRMIGGIISALLALALFLPPGLPMAYAETPSAADSVEKTRPSGGQNVQSSPSSAHSTHEVKRRYAKQSGETPKPQRLSPEQRRQLRRDIKDAGRQIYPPRR